MRARRHTGVSRNGPWVIRPVAARGLAVWCLLALLPMAAARAGDEEINPSVYQIFDPETGYFIEVDPPPDAQPSANSQSPAPAATPADPQSPAGASTAAAPEQTGPGAPGPDQKPWLIAGVALLLVLIAGFALRKKGS